MNVSDILKIGLLVMIYCGIGEGVEHLETIIELLKDLLGD
jgi:hypothetical protein